MQYGFEFSKVFEFISITLFEKEIEKLFARESPQIFSNQRIRLDNAFVENKLNKQHSSAKLFLWKVLFFRYSYSL